MTKTFSVEELEEIVAPESLWGVLESLRIEGLVEKWRVDFRGGYVVIDIPKSVEVKEVIECMQNYVFSKNTGKRGAN